jgi:aryl sulfotransferase
MSGIIWLASYPKTGNTWFRIFLTNLRGDRKGPAHISELDSIPIASARDIFDNAAGVESSDLTVEEIERLRPEIYEHIAANSNETLFMKVHDAYTYVDSVTPLFPEKATLGSIYLIRNPLDVVVSFAHHSGWDYDRAISTMADESYAFCSKTVRLHNQLRQRLLSWSGHVVSWVEAPGFPVCILRYEDLRQNPVETFGKAVRFSGLEFEREQIMRALNFSCFDELQRQERANGFREKSPHCKAFFRKGVIGSWREELSKEQVERVINDHRMVMHRFGYLGRDDKILY